MKRFVFSLLFIASVSASAQSELAYNIESSIGAIAQRGFAQNSRGFEGNKKQILADFSSAITSLEAESVNADCAIKDLTASFESSNALKSSIEDLMLAFSSVFLAIESAQRNAKNTSGAVFGEQLMQVSSNSIIQASKLLAVAKANVRSQSALLAQKCQR